MVKIANQPEDEVLSLDKTAVPIHETVFHYNSISKPFEKALKKYVDLDPDNLKKLLDSLPDEPKKGDQNFLGMKFEDLFNIPVEVARADINTVKQQNSSGNVESLARTIDLNASFNTDEFSTLAVDTNRVFFINLQNQIAPYPSTSIQLPPPPNNNHGTPTTPYITFDSALTGGKNTEVLLNTQSSVTFQGNIFTLGAAGGNIINAYFMPPARNGSIEDRSHSGEVILTTPEGNTLTLYTNNVNGHVIGDIVYTLNDAILTPPQPYTVINSNKVHKDLFQYSVTDSFADTGVGTIEIQIIDDAPAATDQNAPSTINESDIQTIGSNLLATVNTLSGSLIVPSVQATPPGPGDLSDNRFGANGGIVSNVTVAGGTTVFNGTTYTVTDAQGNTLVVDAGTGNYVYTLKTPFHNTNNQPYDEHFTYQFRDFEGQTASAVLTVTSNDDAPVAVNLTNTISEVNILNIGSNGSSTIATATGLLVPATPTVSTSRYGADGPATAGGVTNATLTGQSGTSGVTANTTFGTITNTQIANSNGAFTNANLGHASIVVTDSLGNTLVIDRITNAYVYTLNAAFTDVNNNPAVITYTYELTDSDGSTASAQLAITVSDDHPIATSKLNTANETLLFVNGTNTATGNLITDNNGSGVSLLGADGGTVSQVNSTTAVAGIINVGTTYGSIEVYTTAQSGHQPGDYIYSLDSAKTTPVNDALLQVVDSISYQLADNDGSTASSDLKITVTLNQPPTANNDSGTTDQGTILSVLAANGVLVNDTVSAGDTKVVSAVNGVAGNVGNQFALASGALLTLNSDGSYSYNPNGNFLGGGSDSFTYTMTEAEGLTSSATVNLTITGPQAVDDTGQVNESAILTMNAISGLLSNDVKSPVDNTITVYAVNGSTGNVGVQFTLPSGALLKVQANGSYTYNPNVQFECGGSDSFTYQIADGHNGLSNVATVSITINGNGAPVAADDSGSTHLLTPLVVNALNGVLSNDTPNDADSSISVASVNGVSGNVGNQFTLPSGATLTLNSDGSYTYTANPVWSITQDDNFTYTAETPCGTSNTATVTISVIVPPIVLDLNDDGIDLIALEHSQVSWAFPCGNDHFIGWVGPEDGILVYDYNGDGKITNIDQFSFVSYHPDAKTDLDGLRLAFDSNHDGVFDINDEHFSQFAVWQDKNSDGIADEGELISLIDRGITSINLTATPQNQDIAGNIIFGTTTYQTSDGQSHLAADVGLKVGHVLELKDVLFEQSEIDFSSLGENTKLEAPANPVPSPQIVLESAPMMDTSFLLHIEQPVLI